MKFYTFNNHSCIITPVISRITVPIMTPIENIDLTMDFNDWFEIRTLFIERPNIPYTQEESTMNIYLPSKILNVQDYTIDPIKNEIPKEQLVGIGIFISLNLIFTIIKCVI